MDKNYSLLKKKAIKLRNKGLSYNEIRKNINVAKSTLSLWLKSIPLSPEFQKRLYTKQIEILSLGSQSQKERRAKEVEKIIESSKKEIDFPLSKDTFRLMGAALYWAEGSKSKMFILTNSDPNLILFFVKWVNDIIGIPAKNLRARLNIYPQQDENIIKKFWSNLTNIPLNNFGKSYIKPINKGYKKNNLYYGTIRIEVPKSVNIKYKVFGWIQAVLKNIATDVKITERKWASLKQVVRPINLNNKIYKN